MPHLAPPSRWNLHWGRSTPNTLHDFLASIAAWPKPYSGAQPNCERATQSILHCVKKRHWRGKAGGGPGMQPAKPAKDRCRRANEQRRIAGGGAPLFLLRF